METTTTKLQKLIKKSSTYKMFIPLEVEKKIRLLCREFTNIEWSGILFYKVEGTFEDGTLKITCVDIYQMDIGNAGTTEFEMTADVSAYMVDHPELLSSDIYTGLIHSHHSMATFFSGTDTATLQAEGNDTNHFVSLIVNNEGTYTAGITRKVSSEMQVTEKCIYNTWGNAPKEEVTSYTEKEDSIIQWFSLEITKETDEEEFTHEMLNRISQIRQAKAAKAAKAKPVQRPIICNTTPLPPSMSPAYHAPYSGTSKQTSFDYAKSSIPTQSPHAYKEIDTFEYEKYHINPKIVDLVVKQTLTCSAVILDGNKIDINKWATLVDSLYTRRFGDVKTFEAFATNFADFLVNNTDDPDALVELDYTEMSMVLAYEVKSALEKLPQNKWIDTWIEVYDDFLI